VTGFDDMKKEEKKEKRREERRENRMRRRSGTAQALGKLKQFSLSFKALA